MNLIKIALNELEIFCSSELFQKFPIKPISPLRVKSYLANPRALRTDIVLYMFIEDNELVAFRTVFGDWAFEEDQPIRFGWCSGVWVNPKYRGKHLWKPLLEEAMNDWGSRLMLTNYAPKIQKLYLDSGLFQGLTYRSGYRFYFYPDFKEIVKNKIPQNLLKLLAPPASWIFSKLFFFKQLYSKFHLPSDTTYVEIDQPDETCLNLLNKDLPHTLFRRGMTEFEWIFNYPWVTDRHELNFHYPFSYDKISYNIKTIKLFINNEMVGFFIYSIVNRKMKVLYHYEKMEFSNTIALPIIHIARQNRISHLTVLSPFLSMTIKAIRGSFLFHKPFESNVYTSFKIMDDGNRIYDGDGDNCFT